MGSGLMNRKRRKGLPSPRLAPCVPFGCRVESTRRRTRRHSFRHLAPCRWPTVSIGRLRKVYIHGTVRHVMLMLRHKRCCQLCPRPRRRAATALAVSISIVPPVSGADQSKNDKIMTAAGIRCAPRRVRCCTHMPLHRPPASRSCCRSQLDIDKQRLRGRL